MEVFTFLKATGGGPSSLERIKVMPIGHTAHSHLGQPASAGSAITSAVPLVMSREQLRAFDASQAQCFKPEDRDRLLGIIEAGYGDFDEFNAIVRGVFEKRLSFEHISFTSSHQAPRATTRWAAMRRQVGRTAMRRQMSSRRQASLTAMRQHDAYAPAAEAKADGRPWIMRVSGRSFITGVHQRVAPEPDGAAEHGLEHGLGAPSPAPCAQMAAG